MIDFDHEMGRFMHHSQRQWELDNFLRAVKRLRGEHDMRTNLGNNIQKLMTAIHEEYQDFESIIEELRSDLKKTSKPSIVVL
jgi:protein associated with RNAse G/E